MYRVTQVSQKIVWSKYSIVTETLLREVDFAYDRRACSAYVHTHVLSVFSRVQLCATPWTVARQAPLSMGFSRQELPFPPPEYIHTRAHTHTCAHTHTLECYSATKKRMLPLAAAWTDKRALCLVKQIRERRTDAVWSHSHVKSKKCSTLVNVAKKNPTHSPREQASGYQ